MTERNYAELVTKAEQAVADVKDPELKRVAFQKVLDDLLSSESSQSARSKQPSKRRSHRTISRKQNVSKTGPQAYIEEMITDGFFSEPVTIAQVKAELENRGHHIALTSLSGPLQKLTQRRKLRRQRSKSGNKETFVYSKW